MLALTDSDDVAIICTHICSLQYSHAHMTEPRAQSWQVTQADGIVLCMASSFTLSLSLSLSLSPVHFLSLSLSLSILFSLSFSQNM